MSGASNTLPFRFYAITDRTRVRRRPWTDHVRFLLDAGVQAVQLREKDMSTREILLSVDEIVRTSGEAHKLWVNDRADIVLARDLAGVHLSERSMRPDIVRKIVQRKFIGVSVHSHEGAVAAARDGADFVVAGPIAPTLSKSSGHEVMQENVFRHICESVAIPVFALGGVTLDRVPDCLKMGATGIAGISLAMDEDQVESRLKSLRRLLGQL